MPRQTNAQKLAQQTKAMLELKQKLSDTKKERDTLLKELRDTEIKNEYTDNQHRALYKIYQTCDALITVRFPREINLGHTSATAIRISSLTDIGDQTELNSLRAIREMAEQAITHKGV